MADGRLRWGVLSTARIGRTLFMPGVRASAETELAAIASRSIETARQVAGEFSIPRAYGSYEELLGDPDIDAVYIPLPNSMHTEWTIKAAQAGKHVLCEKPVARTARQAQQMADACANAGVVLMEAFMWRYHPQQARVRALIESGAIGEVRSFRGSFSFLMGADPSNVRLQESLEGGSLMDVGCYPVNVARWVFGGEPLEVVARSSIDPEYRVETAFAGVLRFAGDRFALIDSSFRQVGRGEYEVVGTTGRVVVERAYRPDDAAGRMRIYRGSDEQIEEVPAADQYALEADHFARCVRAGRLLPPAEDGVAQARVIEALYTSAASGQAVPLT